jgi:3-oxoacyl-[acyl-carrier protein] reductase
MGTRKVALVTGAATGIGAAAVGLLAERGVDVVINHLGAVDRAAAETTAEVCRAKGVDARIHAADVGVEPECRGLIDGAVAAFGRLDYLVNNAGASAGRDLRDLDGVTVDEFRRVNDVNCVGPFMLARAAAPHMRKLGRGAIVNIASMAGLIGMGSSYAYLASKAGLINITRALARVLAPQIRVNVICPGLINTQFPAQVLGPERFAKVMANFEATSVLKSVIEPADVAETIVWLLEGAPQITGEVVRVDGGGHLGGAI